MHRLSRTQPSTRTGNVMVISARRDHDLALTAHGDVFAWGRDVDGQVTADGPEGHVFISYVRENAGEVDSLQAALEKAGVRVWRDTDQLWPGQDWRMRIRRAISDDALVFIACFSHESGQRDRSYQNEELNLAIEQLRLHRPDDPWLIPVRLDDCEIPDRELGAGRTLASLQHADLFGDRRDDETSRLVESVLRMLGRDPGQLGQDLSPTRQAVLAYLRALADWLNTDQWPSDLRFGGPELRSAELERKLRIAATNEARARDQDADTVADRSRRLVVLGEPGSGKTWFARKTARRCALRSLAELESGTGLASVELPLYTTCSELFTAKGDIRLAVVSSALDQLPDLGGSHTISQLSKFFTERNTPTLLVLDSLDEARGPAERLRQAGSLPWRIVLTSRPSSWNRQLTVDEASDAEMVGLLQPLRYPDDVDPFIRRWFGRRDASGDDLVRQIAQRAEIQQLVTVPILLAFCCIVGGSEPLPSLRHQLYVKVLNRMLTGRWRHDDDSQPDRETCIAILRRWAWSGATSDPGSGIANWPDEIPTRVSREHPDDRAALDHVAVPTSRADVDTGLISRRFVHRTLREQLVAEQVADLPTEEAARVLMPHLWFDVDWEYTAPAAIAMHPERDRLLRGLVGQLTGAGELPADLSAIDAGGELSRLLSRLANESAEDDWPAGIRAVIAGARLRLAQAASPRDLSGGSSWTSSGPLTREALFARLSGAKITDAKDVVSAIVRLTTAPQDRAEARERFMTLITDGSDPTDRATLIEGAIRLAISTEERRKLRGRLLSQLRPLPLPGEVNDLAAGIARLEPTNPEKDEVRQKLISVLPLAAGQRDYLNVTVLRPLVRLLAQLDPTEDDKSSARCVLLEGLERSVDYQNVRELVAGLTALDATDADKAQARARVLDWLEGEQSGNGALVASTALTALGAGEDSRRRGLGLLLVWLTEQSSGDDLESLITAIADLGPAEPDRQQARVALLKVLSAEAGPLLIAAQRQLTLGDRQVLGLVSAAVRGIVRFATSTGERQQARESLLDLLVRERDGTIAAGLAIGLAEFGPAATEINLARETLLKILIVTDAADTFKALFTALTQLDMTSDDQRLARDWLMCLLISSFGHLIARPAAELMVQLDPSSADLRQARRWLLRHLTLHAARAEGRGNPAVTGSNLACEVPLDEAFSTLTPAQIRLLSVSARWRNLGSGNLTELYESDSELSFSQVEALLASWLHVQAGEPVSGISTTAASIMVVGELSRAIAGLEPTAEEKRCVRSILIRLRANQDSFFSDNLPELEPVIEDLSAWKTWVKPPTNELLAAVRRTSNIGDWITALPSLPTPVP